MSIPKYIHELDKRNCRCSIIPIYLSEINDIISKYNRIWKPKDMVLNIKNNITYIITKINYVDRSGTVWFYAKEHYRYQTVCVKPDKYMSSKQCIRIGHEDERID